MKKFLRTIKRILDKNTGGKTDEIYWRFRHFFKSKWAQDYVLEDSLNHPHRKLLVEKISSFFPFNSVLEVGCASGPNLYLLAKKFPEVKLYGIDISSKAIQDGQKWFPEKGVKNVFLSCGKTNNLKKFPSKSIDVCFSDAVLIYSPPSQIEKSLKEMLRVSKKAIILNEWHSDSPKSIYIDHWVHNYKLLLGKFLPSKKINFIKLSEDVWGGDWARYGYIIEITL